jgi:hypothetical protein
MRDPLNSRAVGDFLLILDGQSIDIGSISHHFTRVLALDVDNETGLRERSFNYQTLSLEGRLDELRGLELLKSYLRVPVEVPADADKEIAMLCEALSGDL